MGKKFDREAAAFQALVDSVSNAPLAHIKPCGYIYPGDDGLTYSERRPAGTVVAVAVYAFDGLQQAYAVGRTVVHSDAFRRHKEEQRGIHEYNSWKQNIVADHRRRLDVLSAPK